MNTSTKPIEPGCLAMVITDRISRRARQYMRLGQIVTVVDRWPPQYLNGKHCAVCKTDKNFWDVGPHTICCECGLMRIDPDEEIKNEHEHEELHTLDKSHV